MLLSLHDVTDAGWLRAFGEGLLRHWRPIGLGEFVRRHRAGATRREDLAVTLDDGFVSIRTVVEPVLSGLGIPFTTFACGEVTGGGPAPWFQRVTHLLRGRSAADLAPFWGLPPAEVTSRFVLLNALKPAPHERLLAGLARAERDLGADPAAARADFLSPADLEALARNPLVTIGAHSHTHPILSVLDEAGQEAEIARSRAALAGVLGTPPTLFAYPNGKPADFGPVTLRLLRAHGFEGAVTTVQRPVARGDDALALPRLSVSQGDAVDRVRLKRALPVPSAGDRREAEVRRRFARWWRERV